MSMPLFGVDRKEVENIAKTVLNLQEVLTAFNTDTIKISALVADKLSEHAEAFKIVAGELHDLHEAVSNMQEVVAILAHKVYKLEQPPTWMADTTETPSELN